MLGYLVRIGVSKPTEEEHKELQDALTKLSRRRPDFVRKIKVMSRTELRQNLRARGIPMSAFQGAEVAAAIAPDEAIHVAERYALKLGKALFYLHCGRVLPDPGTVRAIVYTNSALMSSDFRVEDYEVLRLQSVTSRAGKPLDDQFSYRFTVAKDGEAMAFLVMFGESMAFSIFVFETPELAELANAV